MLSQNGTQQRQQQSFQGASLSTFMPSNNNFEVSPYSNLDPSQAAKQMAALTAANQARIANGRSTVPPAPLQGGTSSAPYLGGIPSINNSAGPSTLDMLTNTSITGQNNINLHMPNNHALPSIPNPAVNQSYLDSPIPGMSQPSPSPGLRGPAAKRQFLLGLANLMAKRGSPLPPALTGSTTNPPYDPNVSPFKSIEVSDVGVFKVAGKDVDLYKLWSFVVQGGGGVNVTNNNGWAMLLPQFELPEQIPQPQGNGSTPVAAILAQYYTVLLHPFEDAYKKNIQEQQRKAARQMGVQNQHMSPMHPNNPMSPRPNSSNMMGMMGQPVGNPQPPSVNGRPQVPQAPQTPHPPSSQFVRTPSQGAPQNSSASLSAELSGMTNPSGIPDINVLDQDAQGLKRKLEPDEGDNKRVRLKTGSEPPENSSTALVSGDQNSLNPSVSGSANSSQPPVMPRPRAQPSRRKIEYVPMAREVDTFGGRDLSILREELSKLPLRRWRPIESWGIIDIEALTMSIRSGLATEVSYALTTLLNLAEGSIPTPINSQVAPPQPLHPPFSLAHCPELVDELLDLVEETAFEGVADSSIDCDLHVFTHREIVQSYEEAETELFAGLKIRNGVRDARHGPQPRPGHILMIVTALFRSLTGNQERAVAPENPEFVARHERFLDLMLRLCMVKRNPDGRLQASSHVLTIADVVRIRKDLLYTLFHVALIIQLPSPTSPSITTLRTTRRLFHLVAAYIVDPAEALVPSATAARGNELDLQTKPPCLANVALDVFTKLCLSDANRQVFAKAVPQGGIWQMMEALAHRLPVTPLDFQTMARQMEASELWQGYIERVIMAMYSLAFLSPPELKKKFKTDTQLRLPSLVFRMVQRFLLAHIAFHIPARRAIEMLKVIDDGEDSFDTSESTVPTMSFGMGYGEVGENGAEKGTGVLAGYRGLAWEVLLGCREVDAQIFSELDILSRVET